MKTNRIQNFTFLIAGITFALLLQAAWSSATAQDENPEPVQLEPGQTVSLEIGCLDVSEPTATAQPTATSLPPTATPEATSTFIPITSTATAQPTATSLPPTATPEANVDSYFFADRTTKILAIGDSITFGEHGDKSYRLPLGQMIADAGYDVDFVGPRKSHPNESWDSDNAGYRGWQQNFWHQQAEANNWYTTHQADIVLANFGHNGDLRSHNRDWENPEGSWAKMLTAFRAQNPNVVFVVAQIIGNNSNPSLDQEEFDEWVAEFNDLAAQFALENSQTEDFPNSPVLVSDQFTDFIRFTHTSDYVHPNAAGSQILAERWLEVLINQ